MVDEVALVVNSGLSPGPARISGCFDAPQTRRYSRAEVVSEEELPSSKIRRDRGARHASPQQSRPFATRAARARIRFRPAQDHGDGRLQLGRGPTSRLSGGPIPGSGCSTRRRRSSCRSSSKRLYEPTPTRSSPHIRTALKEGATAQEILEALETVALPMGMLAFRRGIQAWANEVGLEPIEPSSG